MADVKVSELTATTTVDDTDLLPLSEDLGGGSFGQKKVEAQYAIPVKDVQNVGTAPVGWLKGITARVAEFFSPKAGSNKITITQSIDDIVFDVAEANLVHDNLSGGAATVAHGTTSDLVGKDDAVTMTNKGIDAATNTITNIGASEIEKGIISDLPSKATPVAGDSITLGDSEDTGALKRAVLTPFINAQDLATTDSPEFADVDITTLDQSATTGATAKSVLSHLDSLLTYVGSTFVKLTSGTLQTLNSAIRIVGNLSIDALAYSEEYAQTWSASTTFNFNNGNVQTSTVTSGATLSLSNKVNGSSVLLDLLTDGTGGYSLAFDSTFGDLDNIGENTPLVVVANGRYFINVIHTSKGTVTNIRQITAHT